MGSFGFGAGMVSRAGAQAGAEFSASLFLPTRPVPLQIVGGTWVAGLRASNVYQRDVFAGALANIAFAHVIRLAAGPELHSFGSHAALGGRATLEIPFASTGAAGLDLFARTSLMQNGSQWAIGAALKLAPWKGGLYVGERRPRAAPDLDAAGSWEGILQQLALLQDETSPLRDVLATRSNVVLRFTSTDVHVLEPTIARIGRVLNASSTPLLVTIHAPAPARLALAVTSGGFPAERIRLVNADQITLQVTRPPLVSDVRSAQSSLR